jgi:hypothetical protein
MIEYSSYSLNLPGAICPIQVPIVQEKNPLAFFFQLHVKQNGLYITVLRVASKQNNVA